MAVENTLNYYDTATITVVKVLLYRSQYTKNLLWTQLLAYQKKLESLPLLFTKLEHGGSDWRWQIL